MTGFPESFLVDPHGRLPAIRRGPIDERILREELEPLIRGTGQTQGEPPAICARENQAGFGAPFAPNKPVNETQVFGPGTRSR